VVLDDLASRRAATVLALDVIGTAGLVTLLRKRQLIPSAATALEALRGAGLRLSGRLTDQILAKLGEPG
jgi:predicted nucleic acid-binding protein